MNSAPAPPTFIRGQIRFQTIGSGRSRSLTATPSATCCSTLPAISVIPRWAVMPVLQGGDIRPLKRGLLLLDVLLDLCPAVPRNNWRQSKTATTGHSSNSASQYQAVLREAADWKRL